MKSDVVGKRKWIVAFGSLVGAAMLLVMLPGTAMASDEVADNQKVDSVQEAAAVTDAVVLAPELSVGDDQQNAADESEDADASDDSVETDGSVSDDASATDELPVEDVVADDTQDSAEKDSSELETDKPAAEPAPEVQDQVVSELTPQTGTGEWVIKDLDNGYGFQRYWFDSTGVMAVDRLIDPTEGSSYWAYATRYGYVVRGFYDTGRGLVYVADNDGRLVDASGWLVTGDYTDGVLQRYYIDSEKHAARSGYFTVDGDNFFGQAGVGYVVRGFDGVRYADNEGVLTCNSWLVTSELGHGLQRYWFDAKGDIARNRVIDEVAAGWLAYATPDAYVVRGAFDTGYGMVYLANNEGVIAVAQGWLVTGDYTGGALQRYYFDPVTHAARSGFFVVDGYGDCFGMGGVGYVLRGTALWGDHLLVADNEGRMYRGANGWAVTSQFDGSLQRYWFDTVYGDYFLGAKIGYYLIGDDAYYGREDFGYVARTPYLNPYGLVYMGDRDGKLTMTSWLSNVGRVAWGKALGLTSKTQYLITVACDDCHVILFSGSVGNWVPFADVLAGTGQDQYNDGQGTVRGIFEIGGDGACYNWSDWYYGRDNYHGDYRVEYYPKDDIYYFTGWLLDLGFHSTIPSMGSAESQLGKKVSHGCVRLRIEDAKWIYENCAPGTRVLSY